MQTKKEQWIDKTMRSAENMQALSVSASLRKRLDAIPQKVIILDTKIPMRSVWLVAASLLLLISLNLATVQKSRKNSSNNDSTIYTEYFSYLDEI